MRRSKRNEASFQEGHISNTSLYDFEPLDRRQSLAPPGREIVDAIRRAKAMILRQEEVEGAIEFDADETTV